MPETGRLQEMVNVYTTLEEETDAADGDGTMKSTRRRGFSSSEGIDDLNDGNHKHGIIASLQQNFTRRLFQANYVLLEHQSIKPFVYNLILLLEFLQLLFFAFYRLEINNEMVLLIDDSNSLGSAYNQGDSLSNQT
jgi:hypothetical protein